MSDQSKPKNTVKINPIEGEAHCLEGDGGSWAVYGDGSLEVSLKNVRSVGILDLADVASYVRSEQAGFISHAIRFHSGATAEFAYNSRGQIVSLQTTRGAGVRISKGDELLFVA